MTLTSRQKVLWLAIAGAGCVVLVLLLCSAKPQPPQLPDLRISAPPQMTNGAMLVSTLLSNGTSRNLNIVDDGAGNPFFVLDVGRSNLPGTIGTGLGPLANTLKLNLTPGATLSNAVWVTNPPPRFRLLVEVRDLAAERRRALAGLFRFLAVKARLRKQPTQGDGLDIMLPASPWIEADKISATVQSAAERLKGNPTNGWTQ